MSLTEYAQAVVEAQEKVVPGGIRPEQPKGVVNTLWIPVSSANRTATLNLNHIISGFDKDGILWGRNGNCGTPYQIIEVPSTWEAGHNLRGNHPPYLMELARRVAKKLEKPESYPTFRVLKADDRMPVIKETIKEMENENWKPES